MRVLVFSSRSKTEIKAIVDYLIDKLSEEQVMFVCQNVILDENGNFLNLEDIIESFEC